MDSLRPGSCSVLQPKNLDGQFFAMATKRDFSDGDSNVSSPGEDSSGGIVHINTHVLATATRHNQATSSLITPPALFPSTVSIVPLPSTTTGTFRFPHFECFHLSDSNLTTSIF